MQFDKYQNKLDFYKNRIKGTLAELKDDIGEMRYNLYVSIVEQCNDYEELLEMAELEMQIDFIKYTKENINEPLHDKNINIRDLKKVNYPSVSIENTPISTDDVNELLDEISDDSSEDHKVMALALHMRLQQEEEEQEAVDEYFANEEQDEEDLEDDEEGEDSYFSENEEDYMQEIEDSEDFFVDNNDEDLDDEDLDDEDLDEDYFLDSSKETDDGEDTVGDSYFDDDELDEYMLAESESLFVDNNTDESDEESDEYFSEDEDLFVDGEDTDAEDEDESYFSDDEELDSDYFFEDSDDDYFQDDSDEELDGGDEYDGYFSDSDDDYFQDDEIDEDGELDSILSTNADGYFVDDLDEFFGITPENVFKDDRAQKMFNFIHKGATKIEDKTYRLAKTAKEDGEKTIDNIRNSSLLKYK